ncbi:hypothetical protein [Xanthomonas phage X1]|nr:hypothetical protein [Xanthomonas phage X1]
MKIKGTKIETVDVDIDPLEVIRTCYKRWKSTTPGEFIRNGNWYVEVHTSHSYDELVGPVSDQDMEIYKAFQIVSELISGMK